jgi:hypothetical protein
MACTGVGSLAVLLDRMHYVKQNVGSGPDTNDPVRGAGGSMERDDWSDDEALNPAATPRAGSDCAGAPQELA